MKYTAWFLVGVSGMAAFFALDMAFLRWCDAHGLYWVGPFLPIALLVAYGLYRAVAADVAAWRKGRKS